MQGGKPVTYASKALTKTEEAYAQIEKEMLAIVFALKKFHTYVYGRHDITVETDHLPLVRIKEKPLHQTPLRLQKMKMAQQNCDFNLVGKTGKDIPVADALSRTFLPETQDELLKDVNHFKVHACEVRGANAFSETRWEQLRVETGKDEDLRKLMQVIQAGWPNSKAELDPRVKPFYASGDELTVIENVVFKSNRVVIPKSMQKQILMIIHEGHQGIVRSKQLARDILYWPGMNTQIQELVENCDTCQEKRRQQQRESLMPCEIPNGPWRLLATDLLQVEGRNYLVTIDYYSEYIHVDRMDRGTESRKVIEKLATLFAEHGVPDKLLSNNGPQFISQQFKDFMKNWNCEHLTSSPHHHQSNGMVERANQTIRRMIEKTNGDTVRLQAALLNLRNTPKEAGSPAQRLFNRRTATKVPLKEELREAEIIPREQVTEVLKRNRHRAEQYYNKGTKQLETLKEDDHVRMHDGRRWKPVRVMPGKHPYPRSYDVKTETGRILRCNRKFLMKTKEKENQFEEHDDSWDDGDDGAPEENGPAPHPNPNPNLNPPVFVRPRRETKLPTKFNDYVMI